MQLYLWTDNPTVADDNFVVYNGKLYQNISGNSITVGSSTSTPDTDTTNWKEVAINQGPMGENGNQGPIGETGPQGPIGETGADGADGQPGIAGPQGPAGAPGADGQQGIAGPQGPAGQRGPQGETGDTGPTGPQGETGDQGIAGPQGPKGEAGQDGAAGPTGPQGPKGDAGQDGTDGQDGQDGAPGIAGPQGPKGEQGPIGETGQDGQDGAQGIAGPQGPKGDTGAQGVAGPQGPKGADGNDGAQGSQGVYTVKVYTRVSAGTVTAPTDLTWTPGTGLGTLSGTDTSSWSLTIPTTIGTLYQVIAEFNPATQTTLATSNWSAPFQAGAMGPAGAQGPTGPQGISGPQGPKGDTGATGAAGPAGAQGPTGPQGISGPQGPKGDTGAKGDTGERGPQGETGDTGPQGVAGPQGISGPQGPKGDTGATGPAGATGAKGDKGEQGDQGIAGPQGPKGDTGADGATGATGPQGPKGDTGAQGPAGTAGAQGIAGPQGPKGADGAAGAKGDKGEQGEQGEQGISGPQGPKGDTGAEGPQGPQGNVGPQGPAGTDGAQGLVGPQGPKGDQGPARTGAQGPQGIAGPQGPKGAEGPQGPAGTSATSYVSAPVNVEVTEAPVTVSFTNEDPITVNLNNLPGPQGPAGPTGAQGAPGPQGEQGPSGVPGPQGEQGLPGNDGNHGNDGAPGPQGEQGEQGVPGPQGEQGIQGIPGPQGEQGLEGVPGPQGEQGEQGIPGPQGEQGLEGVPGPQGEMGIQGTPGPQGEQGIQGIPGPQGEQGLQGIPGPQGEQGPTGPKSTEQGPQGIYEVRAYETFSGTPTAPTDLTWTPGTGNGTLSGTDATNWSLDIPTVPTGEQLYIVSALFNPASTTNTTIVTADWSAPYQAGAQGPTGPKGDQGIAGPQGPKGADGNHGNDGIAGPQGPKGDQGIQGISGPQGPKGDTGAEGPKGDQGIQGISGPQGPKGDAGADGSNTINIDGTTGIERLNAGDNITITGTGTTRTINSTATGSGIEEWSSTQSYSLDSLVYDGSAGNRVIFKSLVNNNLNNSPLTAANVGTGNGGEIQRFDFTGTAATPIPNLSVVIAGNTINLNIPSLSLNGYVNAIAAGLNANSTFSALATASATFSPALLTITFKTGGSQTAITFNKGTIDDSILTITAGTTTAGYFWQNVGLTGLQIGNDRGIQAINLGTGLTSTGTGNVRTINATPALTTEKDNAAINTATANLNFTGNVAVSQDTNNSNQTNINIPGISGIQIGSSTDNVTQLTFNGGTVTGNGSSRTVTFTDEHLRVWSNTTTYSMNDLVIGDSEGGARTIYRLNQTTSVGQDPNNFSEELGTEVQTFIPTLTDAQIPTTGNLVITIPEFIFGTTNYTTVTVAYSSTINTRQLLADAIVAAVGTNNARVSAVREGNNVVFTWKNAGAVVALLTTNLLASRYTVSQTRIGGRNVWVNLGVGNNPGLINRWESGNTYNKDAVVFETYNGVTDFFRANFNVDQPGETNQRPSTNPERLLQAGAQQRQRFWFKQTTFGTQGTYDINFSDNLTTGSVFNNTTIARFEAGVDQPDGNVIGKGLYNSIINSTQANIVTFRSLWNVTDGFAPGPYGTGGGTSGTYYIDFERREVGEELGTFSVAASTNVPGQTIGWYNDTGPIGTRRGIQYQRPLLTTGVGFVISQDRLWSKLNISHAQTITLFTNILIAGKSYADITIPSTVTLPTGFNTIGTTTVNFNLTGATPYRLDGENYIRVFSTDGNYERIYEATYTNTNNTTISTIGRLVYTKEY